MNDLTGAGALIRFAFRRDRVRIAVWILSIVVLVAVSGVSVARLFPTQADLDAAAAASENPAVIALQGPAQGLDTLGGQIAFQIGAPGLVVVGLMGLLMMGRLQRGEEEAGRLELVRSLPVGRHAPLVAGWVVVGTMSLAVGVGVTLSMIAQDLGVAGSLSFGLGYLFTGLVFAGVGLVASQITENTRLAYGIAGGVLAVSFVLRAIGDVSDGALSWASPMGWAQGARPWAGERWWPFLIAAACVVALHLAGRAMAARRDLGAGLIPPRPGPPRASARLSSPLGLAARLQRGSLAGWVAAVAFTGAVYGSITDAIGQFVRDNQALADVLTGETGASLVDSYLGTSARVVALIGAGFAVQSTLRLRGEETAMRAEPILATPVSRTRWAFSHLVVALLGTLVVLVANGLAIGISAAIVTGDAGLVPRVVGASLAYAPAIWLLIGFAFALVGVWPRGVVAVWILLSGCLVVAFLGPLLQLPGWVNGLSPFEHVPLSPAEPADALPMLALTIIAIALVAVGNAGIRRRDIG